LSRGRIIAAVVVTAAVVALFAWQQQRERTIAACHSIGGIWNAATSTCDQSRPVIIERERLKRS